MTLPTDSESPSNWSRTWTDLIIPLFLLTTATLVFRFTNLDLDISNLFYTSSGEWKYNDLGIVRAMYTFGAWPIALMALASVILLLLSIFHQYWCPARRCGVFLVLFIAIGPTLLGNVLLKEVWVRPRPRQTVPFGGERPYLQVFENHEGVHHVASFPSGHASAAFGLMAPCFLFRLLRRKWWWTWLGIGLAFGILMGMCRIVQGRHFATDVIWAAGVVYLTGLVLSAILKPDVRDLLALLPFASRGAGAKQSARENSESGS